MEKQGQQPKVLRGLTDGRTDGPTDKVTYRVACTRLKTCKIGARVPTIFTPENYHRNLC